MSKRVYVTVTEKQHEEVEKLVGILGSSAPDVISTVLAMWLYEEKKKEGDKK